MSTSSTPRVLTLWCPDWPVLAAALGEDHPVTAPIAVIASGKVLASSPLARADGVRRGLRRREAQALCPELIVVNHDPARDVRSFEPVVAAVEEIAPGVAVHRPGACTVVARGPASYFGGERRAAERLVDHVADSTGVECQVGVADGIFTAFQAARAGVIVAPGGSARFLAELDVAALERPELVDILRRLGIRTLGGFAALAESDVRTRFGEDAALAHRLASGLDPRPLSGRVPPLDLAVTTELDPPADRVDTAVFATRTLAEKLRERLAGHGLACTRLVIEAGTEHGEELVRQWRHDGVLSAADIADRVRWQLDGWISSGAVAGRRSTEGTVIGGHGGSGRTADSHPLRPTAGITRVRLVPEGLLAQGGLQLGLWGDVGESRERAHRALSRVQGLLGPVAVFVSVPSGGRGPAEQAQLVAWGDERTPERPTDPPWPGRLPAPSPTLLFEPPLPALVYGPDADVVGVTGRHLPTAPLCRVAVASTGDLTHESLLRRVVARGLSRRGAAARNLAEPRHTPPRSRHDSAGSLRPTGQPAPAQSASAKPAPRQRVGSQSVEPVVDVVSWAGPWPYEERWWAAAEARRCARFQVLLADGRALLLTLARGRWWVEAEYD